MNDSELARLLHKLNTPEAGEAARERARYRALLVLGRGGKAQASPRSWFTLGWFAAGALSIALLVTIRPHAPVRENLANDQKILQQMQDLFPRQVDSVVEEDGKINLSISQSPEVGNDQPVVLLFRQGNQTIRILSYSGHRVCLRLAGKENCFEILATPSGGIILEGGDKVWMASENPKIAGYTVHAQALEASL